MAASGAAVDQRQRPGRKQRSEALEASSNYHPARLDKPVGPSTSETLGDALHGSDSGIDVLDLRMTVAAVLGTMPEPTCPAPFDQEYFGDVAGQDVIGGEVTYEMTGLKDDSLDGYVVELGFQVIRDQVPDGAVSGYATLSVVSSPLCSRGVSEDGLCV